VIKRHRSLQSRTLPGLKIPDDISIVGFDDIEMAQALNPPLTTAQVSGEVMAELLPNGC